MTKYKCDYCEVIVDEDDIEYKLESYESYYGVTDLPGRHYFYMPICPVCGQADELYEYDEYDEEEDEDEEEAQCLTESRKS